MKKVKSGGGMAGTEGRVSGGISADTVPGMSLKSQSPPTLFPSTRLFIAGAT